MEILADVQKFFDQLKIEVMTSLQPPNSVPEAVMDSIGRFHEIESNGKLFQVYYHPKYNPIPQSPTSSGQATSHDQPLFLCPRSRFEKHKSKYVPFPTPITSSPEYIVSTKQEETTKQDKEDHSILPLFWCNNKEFDVDSACDICSDSNLGTDYYFCVYHKKVFHKECVQSPTQIKHPYHPEHSLQLYSLQLFRDREINCLSCGRIGVKMVYYCSICEVMMHPICAMKSIPFVVDQPKTHDHPLTFFPRQASLTCNVCGLLRKLYPTFICARCNFVAHNDCMYSPRIIKISHHPHRISYITSLQSEKWFCGVCRQSMDECYGAYACGKCSDYVVHLKCALGKDVWDGEELEGVPEKNDLTKDPGPFDMISHGEIHHFLHDHRLLLEVNIVYDENKFCQACALPIYQGNVYSCMECDFILHEICTNVPRRLQHALHPHPLILKAACQYSLGVFLCNACGRLSNGFVYECRIGKCRFYLDARCALISEPFDYKGHKHPLFLSLDPVVEKPICHVCRTQCRRKQLNCIKCDFIVCMKCATLPDKARYKHDRHYLTILWGEQVCEEDWCEVCERNLGDTGTTVLYWCNECCTTLHIECLLGEEPYSKKPYGLLPYVPF